jgi:LmbE family N-acetylglucosaminyl deacetylase
MIAFGAHPDDVEAVMGGTLAKLVEKGRAVLVVDLCDGEPARYAAGGARAVVAVKTRHHRARKLLVRSLAAAKRVA